MATMRYSFFSQVLNLSTEVTITYPDLQFDYSETPLLERIVARERRQVLRPGMKLQTVYILHGGSDDDTLIHRYTSLERYAEDNCVMTVTPLGNDSFFIDTAYGFRYYTYLTEELPRVMQSLFASSPNPEDNFVLGMAMGGNAALMLAMKHPECYGAVVDLSGGIGCSVDSDYFGQEMRDLAHIRRLAAAFGDPASAVDGEWDIGRCARRNLAEGKQIPPLYLAVGETDFIRDVVRRDRDALKALGIPVHYEEAPGLGHEWAFWDAYVKKALYEWLPLKRTAVGEA